MLLTDQLEAMAKGEDEDRTTPALVFCFNRDECWSVAEQLKGKRCWRRPAEAAREPSWTGSTGRQASARS